MDKKEGAFTYTYSAQERSEVENIRNKYMPKEESKMEQLRKLHNSAGQKAQAWALTVGILGALILGTGMSLFMSDLGLMLGLHHGISMLIGIVAGLAGLVLVALAYPVYNRTLEKERQRIAPEILRLTEELLQ